MTEHALSGDDARRLRLRSQRLSPSTGEDAVADVVRAVCGVQSQEARADALAVRARSRGLTATDVETALYEDRSVVRTWCMRGTLHLVAASDLPRLRSVFGPVFVARSRRRLRELGLDDERCERAMDAIRDALGDGPLTRDETAESLRRAGIDVDPGGQAIYHLVRRAALLGILCEVAPVDGNAAYGLLEDWVSLEEPRNRETALAGLARRYLAAYGPVALEDFASWSGLHGKGIRTAWERVDADDVLVDGRPARMLTHAGADRRPPAERAPVVRLLPGYDAYLLGYAPANRPISPEHRSRIQPGGGVIRPTVIVDGRAVATWRLDRSRATASVSVDAFDDLADYGPRIEAEVNDVGRFLEIEVDPPPIDYPE